MLEYVTILTTDPNGVEGRELVEVQAFHNAKDLQDWLDSQTPEAIEIE